MNLGSCNQSTERTFSFTVGVAYTCIKATLALRIQSVNIVSIRPPSSHLFLQVWQVSSQSLLPGCFVFLLLLGVRAKAVSHHRKGVQIRLASYRKLSIRQVRDDLY